VRGIDGTSRNNKRLDGVATGFQVRNAAVEAHGLRNKARDIFANDPSRPDSFNNSQHFRPEIAVIFNASALPGRGPWLAKLWEPAADKVNSICIGGFLVFSFCGIIFVPFVMMFLT
jgi:hypothetical protein